MTKNKKKQIADPRTQIVVLTSVAEKERLAAAAKAGGYRSLNAYVTDVLRREADALLGEQEEQVSLAGPKTVGDYPDLLHLYLADSLPKETDAPAAVLPSMRSFATMFSDRNRKMLRHMAIHKPASIRELAEDTAYSYQQLSRMISQLESYGIVRYVSGQGAKLMPRLALHRIRLTIPLSRKPLGRSVLCAIKSKPDEDVPARHDLLFGSIDQFASHLSPSVLRTVKVIAESNPASTVVAAKLLGRDINNLYRAMKHLEALDIATLSGETPRKPLLTAESIELELILEI